VKLTGAAQVVGLQGLLEQHSMLGQHCGRRKVLRQHLQLQSVKGTRRTDRNKKTWYAVPHSMQYPWGIIAQLLHSSDSQDGPGT
jgi:hypothetical protein